jgi:serpin B
VATNPHRNGAAALFFALLLLLLAADGCGGGPSTATTGLARSTRPLAAPSEAARADLPEVVKGNNAFAWELFQASRPATENYVLSPYTVYLSLAMTWAGAAGETERDLAQTLHFTLPQEQLHPALNLLNSEMRLDAEGGDRAPALALTSSLWGQEGYPFVPAFLDTLAENYGAGMRQVDFTREEESRQAINDWVGDETQGRVEELLPPGSIDPGWTRLVLATALHFKGSWSNPFMPAEPAPFHRPDGSTVEVPAMSHNFDFNYAETADFQAVELPYQGDAFSMVLLLPAPGLFESVTQRLDSSGLESLLPSLKADTPVILSLPRFSYSSAGALKESLTELGMDDAFGAEADFSGMTTENVAIDDVYGQALISVDEQGTEAAGAGAAVVVAGVDQKMVLDRPFLFLIRHRPSGAILFVGQVTDPSQSGSWS